MDYILEKYFIGKKIVGIEFGSDFVSVEVEDKNGERNIFEATVEINWREESADLDIKTKRKKIVFEDLIGLS